MKYLILLAGMLLFTYESEGQSAIPILCYHNIYTGMNHKSDILHISYEQLNNQLKTLADSGYHSILPDELLRYLSENKHTPPKTFMITFDDSHEEHFSMADSLLRHYGFRGVFFVMTVPLGKRGYMTAAQLKLLADRGHVIAAHTWDHPHLYPTGKMDWDKQLLNPRKVLEKMTGHHVWYFAYPYGEWNDTIISHLEASGYRAAFQLNEHPGKTLYTIRRMMVDGRWSGVKLQQTMNNFKKTP